jgi:hypothetical protein
VIYIPSIRDIELELPDTRKLKHDGYFMAVDTGGAIKQNHIDVFTGEWIKPWATKVIRSKPSGTFDAYVASDVNIVAKLRDLHVRP